MYVMRDHSLHTLYMYHTVNPKFVQLNNSKMKKTTGLEKFNEFANVHFKSQDSLSQ